MMMIEKRDFFMGKIFVRFHSTVLMR
jgi:hypothetical protein